MSLMGSFSTGSSNSASDPESDQHRAALQYLAMGHFRTHASQQTFGLFDHLVGAAEQGKWHGEAKRLCRLHVDYEFELCALLHR